MKTHKSQRAFPTSCTSTTIPTDYLRSKPKVRDWLNRRIRTCNTYLHHCKCQHHSQFKKPSAFTVPKKNRQTNNSTQQCSRTASTIYSLYKAHTHRFTHHAYVSTTLNTTPRIPMLFTTLHLPHHTYQPPFVSTKQ